MKLKCIGGPNDREYHDVPKYQCEHDMVRIYCYSKLNIADYHQPSPIPDRVTIEHNFYIVTVIKYMENDRLSEFKFLRYQGMSVSEALRIALIY